MLFCCHWKLVHPPPASANTANMATSLPFHMAVYRSGWQVKALTILADNRQKTMQPSIHASGFIYSQARARTCRHFKEPRNRFPARRAGTTTLFCAPARQVTQAGEIDSSDSIPGLHKRVQIRAQKCKRGMLLLRQPFPPSHLHSFVHNSWPGKRGYAPVPFLLLSP